ncbi:hypothetical protein CP03DC29_0586A, partial [Chlamydia psittaci 03DC29]
MNNLRYYIVRNSGKDQV